MKILTPSTADIEKLGFIKSQEEVFRQEKYSKGIVVKPWGYEYLWFELLHSAGWVLWLGPGDNTSLHCHENKATALAVISGLPEIVGFDFVLRPSVGDVLLLAPGCFHQTRNISTDQPLCVLEIETPIDKTDLVRYSDGYGRNHSKYEAVEDWSDDRRGLNSYHRANFVNDSFMLRKVDENSKGWLSIASNLRYSFRVGDIDSSLYSLENDFYINVTEIVFRCQEIASSAGCIDLNKSEQLIISWGSGGS